MKSFKRLFSKIALLLFCLLFSIAGFSQVAGIDPRTDVRDVDENDLSGLPALTVNLDWLSAQMSKGADGKTKFFIGSNAVTTEKIKGGPRVTFDNSQLQSLIQACKAHKLSSIDFQVAAITNQKDVERNLRKHGDLTPAQANMLLGKKTILIKVPSDVLTSPAGFMKGEFVGAYVYIEIGKMSSAYNV